MSDTYTCVLGFDIGGTQVRTGVSDGTSIMALSSALLPQDISPHEQVRFIADLGLMLLRDVAANYVCNMAGVALAAQVDAVGQVVQWPNRPSWKGLAFQALLELYLGIPLIIEDDANAAAVAEWRLGAGQGYQHLLVAMVGTGVGAGLIINNQLYRGAHGWAGELGHIIMQKDGYLCGCGRQGCLQGLASGRALENIAHEKGLANSRAITEAASRKEAWAIDIVRMHGTWLGIGLANVVNLLNLEAVVVGGGLSHPEAVLWPYMEDVFNEHLLNRTHQQVVLHHAMLPDTAGVLGALYLATQAQKVSATIEL